MSNERNTEIPPLLHRLQTESNEVGDKDLGSPSGEDQLEMLLDELSAMANPLGNLAQPDLSSKQQVAVSGFYDEVDKKELEVMENIKRAISTAADLDELFRNLKPLKRHLKTLIENNENSNDRQHEIVVETVIGPLLANEKLKPWHRKVISALANTDLLSQLNTRFLDSGRLDDYLSNQS